jgi:hypothetical protein
MSRTNYCTSRSRSSNDNNSFRSSRNNNNNICRNSGNYNSNNSIKKFIRILTKFHPRHLQMTPWILSFRRQFPFVCKLRHHVDVMFSVSIIVHEAEKSTARGFTNANQLKMRFQFRFSSFYLKALFLVSFWTEMGLMLGGPTALLPGRTVVSRVPLETISIVNIRQRYSYCPYLNTLVFVYPDSY